MTTTTEAIETPARASRAGLRFGLAFLVGLGAAFLVGIGGIYAYEQQHVGRILPGVRVGDVDVSGLTRDEAIARLRTTYAAIGQGSVTIDASLKTVTIPYAAFGRHADAEAMADAALAVGRDGTPVDRAVSEVRTVVHGVTLPVQVALDADALGAQVAAALGPLERPSVDGSIEFGKTDYQIRPAVIGHQYDERAVTAAILQQVGPVDAPASVSVPATLTTVTPSIDDVDVEIARTTADRMVSDVTLALGAERWTIPAATVRSWLSFGTTPDGRVVPVADPAKVAATVKAMAKKIDRAPKNASYLVGKTGGIVGITESHDGRATDDATTAEEVQTALSLRAAGQPDPAVAVAVTVVKPTLDTATATKTAPLMKRISTWTTYFPISDHNGYGANIWIPAAAIDGTVLAPGQKFDFWKAIGEVSYAKGYRDGGAIINGHTEPTGALAGGICSCSTTLFNAALRAGLEMGARRNHYYYINRYPLGLDATVYKSGSGSVQTMSFTNDTPYPILIRSYRTHQGLKGYVRFDVYSVPTGRKVSFSTPIVKNVVRATTIVQYTSTLAPGRRSQTEYPADGKDVWVTRTVTDASGKVIHKETFYSHYARVNGIILIGRASSSGTTSTPAPKPTPTPTPSPTP